jgi:hypothetical protein
MLGQIIRRLARKANMTAAIPSENTAWEATSSIAT